MTIAEQISTLAAEQQRLLGDYSVDSHDKRERLASIANRIAQLYAEKNQADADRRTALSDRGRR